MTTRDVNKARIGLHRVENAETISSPHTYAHAAQQSSGGAAATAAGAGGGAHAAVPATTLPDRPVVSRIRIRSAVAGVAPEVLRAMCAPTSGDTDSSAQHRSTAAATRAAAVKSEQSHSGGGAAADAGNDDDEEQQQQQHDARHGSRRASRQQSARGKRETGDGVKQEQHSEDDGDEEAATAATSAASTRPRRGRRGDDAGDASCTTRRVLRMSFDVSGISPPIANMMRRLMTTEVPTLAFDRVLIEENDSVVLDELLCHRIGLVPLAGPVARMEYVTADEASSAGNNSAAAASNAASSGGGSLALDPRRVLVFDLCAEGRAEVPVTPVYSSALRWVPLPGQEAWQQSSCDDDRVFLVHDDILLTKLGPQQKLKLRAFAIKGIAAVHAKWSPVAACYYAMQTSITLTAPVCGADAEALVKTSAPGVFGIDANGCAVVLDASKYTMDRECLRTDLYPGFASKVCIEKDKTRVRFHVESVGQLHPATIVRHALALFAERCRDLARVIQGTEVVITDAHAPM